MADGSDSSTKLVDVNRVAIPTRCVTRLLLPGHHPTHHIRQQSGSLTCLSYASPPAAISTTRQEVVQGRARAEDGELTRRIDSIVKYDHTEMCFHG